MRRSAAQVLEASKSGLERLRATAEDPVDTSDIPVVESAVSTVKRLPDGTLDKGHDTVLRRMILDQLGKWQMTRYELWTVARGLCPRLPESAVYEFLRGQRMIGIAYAEALMYASGLIIKSANRPGSRLANNLAPGQVKKGLPLKQSASKKTAKVHPDRYTVILEEPRPLTGKKAAATPTKIEMRRKTGKAKKGTPA